MNLKYLFSVTSTITFSKKEIILIFTFFVVAFIVRFYGLGNLGFNNDEAIYAGQAASLATYSEYQNQFSIFRAHPLLLQFMVSVSFHFFGISELTARIVPVFLSCGIVIITYFIAKYLYNFQTAILSLVIISFLPYHIIISKQVIVDVSMSFFFALALLLVILYYRKPSSLLLYGIGLSSGLCFLSKEIGIISFIISITSIIIINKKIEIKNILLIVFSFVFVTSPYWISFLTIEEARESLLEYIYWQSSRPGNHDWFYYFEILFNDVLGYVLSILVVIAYLYLLFSKRNWSFKNILIPLLWIPLPLIFYQMISVKGYHFLYSLTPFFVIFGMSVLSNLRIKKIPQRYIVLSGIISLILISNNHILYEYLLQIPYNPVLGEESVYYMKDTALWIKENTPKNSTFLTLYTHMSNIIKFYALRDSIAIQANNNPSYQKIENIDMSILAKKINYIVYEKVQINNGKFLENKSLKLEDYIQKYHATPLYTNYQNSIRTENSKVSLDPAIIVYALN